MRSKSTWIAAAILTTLAWNAPRAEGDTGELEELRRTVEGLAAQNAAMQQTVRDLEREVRRARDEARAAQDLAGALPAVSGAAAFDEPGAAGRYGRPRLQLLDLSLDVLASAGGSSATDEELEGLQGGDHDPRQRGFTLQAAELSLLGAVDPFFEGEAHIVYFLDGEGKTRIELEEAFATSRMLPFGLEERGLQLEAGQFFTEFGRINPQHAHFWHWQDQPVVLSRFFGKDGMRGPGVRLGWLTPLPWFSEWHFGLQSPQGETMVSFLANDEVFEERPIGGRPFAEERVGSVNDLVKLLRWVNGFDVSDTVSTQIGLSALHGPNATGDDGETWITGADVVVKWRPLQTDRGWPFVVFESELAHRAYHADDFFGCPDGEEPCTAPILVPDDTLRDWGGYAQLLWGFRRGWAAGLRFEHATGHGPNFDSESEAFVSRRGDALRDNRTRLSPLLIWHPSEFSRVRLQYNFDRTDHLDDDHAHSVWAGIEFLFGSHPAHAY